MSTAPARPLHLRWSSIALVFVGGTVGTLLRYGVALALPDEGGMPWATLVVNVVGAFVLAWLLAALARRGDDVGMRRGVRLMVGTGLLGGFTTYSTFAVGTDGLFTTGHPWGGVLYAAVTVVAGAVASLVGIIIGSRGKR